MDYLERLFTGIGPLDFVRDTFRHVRIWLLREKVATAEADFLAEMSRKVDWSDEIETREFLGLLQYFSARSSISEDLSWGEVVGLE